MNKVVVLGPESSGKTTLALELCQHFNGCLVREFARNYLDKLTRTYEESDLLTIAEGQINLENEIYANFAKTKSFMFCDTDLTVLKIWSEYKYGRCDPRILKTYHERKYDLYLLTYPNTKWEPDPQRENPNDRMDLFSLYKKDLESRKIQYYIIDQLGQNRVQQAIEIIHNEYRN